jgi:hypothetical protein
VTIALPIVVQMLLILHLDQGICRGTGGDDFVKV